MAKYNKIYDENFNVIGVQEVGSTSTPIKVYDANDLQWTADGLSIGQAKSIMQDIQSGILVYIINVPIPNEDVLVAGAVHASYDASNLDDGFVLTIPYGYSGNSSQTIIIFEV